MHMWVFVCARARASVAVLRCVLQACVPHIHTWTALAWAVLLPPT